MIHINTPCAFAAYNSKNKKLESSIIEIGENTSILCNQDELMKDVYFTSSKANLITYLKNKNITNNDGTEIDENS